MSTDEERIKILKMLAEGIITADEAEELLDVSSASEQFPEAEETTVKPVETPSQEEQAAPAGELSSGPNWLHIRIDDLTSGQAKVNVNIPLRWLKLGMKFGSNFAPGLSKVDWKSLGASLATTGDGTLIDVIDEIEGDHVKIYVD